MTEAAATHESFLEKFADVESRLRGTGPQWLRRARADARKRFAELGLPSPDLEAWKNTNVSAIAGTRFRPADPAAAPSAALPQAGKLFSGPRLVFVDGRFAPGLSEVGERTSGCEVTTLAEILESAPERVERYLLLQESAENPFHALNTLLVEDGGVILVDDGVDVEEPIHLVYLTTGGTDPLAAHPRTLIVAGKESRVRVVETFAGNGEGPYLSNSVARTIVGDAATVDHYRIQLEDDQAFHISNLECVQGRNSRLRTFNINIGARLARHDIRCVLDGEGADSFLGGLYVPRGAQHVDSQTVLDHAKPHCNSRELYKGILSGKARSIFKGRVIVRQDAQKTDAKQSNPNLLLSESALAHTRPQLEIYADDVKCTHGATVGRLDADAIFYLRSRGINEQDARRLMVEAFAGELLDQIGLEPLRDSLRELVGARLAAEGNGK